MSTCNQLDLRTPGSQPVMTKSLPGTGPPCTRAKSCDHEIVRAQKKKNVQRPSLHTSEIM